MKSLREHVELLVAEARKKTFVAKACGVYYEAPVPAGAIVEGWSLCLDTYTHDSVEHFGFSAKLHPPGRGSTTEDWNTLGAIVAEVSLATGYSSELPMPEPLVPIDQIHPNATIHWTWHGDSSSVDAAYLAAIRTLLEALTPRDPAATPTTAGRNEPCPCGSGRKFKKCHGGN